MSTIAVPEYSVITERPDNRASRLQLRILQTRYDFAARLSAGQVVLEAACGAGVGLGMLAGTAEYVVGGDIDPSNCASARESYAARTNLSVMNMDVERTPFQAGVFGVVVLFEALYYLKDAATFLKEARRLLTPNGVLLISTVNCEWAEFNPSPFSTKYHGAAELRTLLAINGFDADLFGAFPDIKTGTKAALTGRIKQFAVKHRLIPRTMKGKEWLKRVFHGKLEPIPRDLAFTVQEVEPLVPLDSCTDASQYRMLYALCRPQ
ncbi:MAG: class I SAM-dependent methyltransferase [Acidobacteriota bacterium]